MLSNVADRLLYEYESESTELERLALKPRGSVIIRSGGSLAYPRCRPTFHRATLTYQG